MANLNLSEFTEKLFVANADHTFIWDTAASISKRVSRNSWLNSGTLTSDAPVTISQTWNNAAVGFNALVVNAAGTSGTNSASGSLLLNLQVNTASAFFVRKDGAVYGSSNAVFASSVGVGLFGSTLSFYAGVIGGGRSAVSIADGWSYAFSSGAQAVSSQDVFLTRDGVGTLALRNGTSAQTFNVYGTYTSGTSYERLTLSAPSAANAIIGTNKGSGGGTARGLDLHTDGSARMTITAAGNVGIGTTSPTFRLSVQGDTECRGKLYVTQSSPTTALVFDSTVGGVHRIYAEATQHIALQSGGAIGNVGIGTSTPTSKLHVVGDGLITGTVGIGDTGTSLKQFVIAGQAISNSLYLSAPQYIGLNAPIVALMNGGVRSAMWDRLTGITLTASSYYGFGSHETDAGFAADTILRRDGEPYHLATRNGTNGQKFSVYGTYPGAAWERFTITAPTSGNVLLGTYKGTGGIARGLEFQTDGVSRWTIATNGDLLASTDATYNIGAATANRPVNINASSSIRGEYLSMTSGLAGVTRSYLTSPANGVITLTQGTGSDFNRIQFGGTGDAFPAIARDGAGIKFTGAAAGSTAWIKVPPVAVSALPLAATAGAGARAFVNDALAPTFGNAVTGGGAVLVPVYSDGSAWYVG